MRQRDSLSDNSTPDAGVLTNTADDLLAFVTRHPQLVVLTGAGVSAPSGIPTYRNAEGIWMRNAPIQHRDFLTKPAARQRYWARSFAGWPAVLAAQPNSAHYALAQLESRGHIATLVTQNVDRLHQRAGHRVVVDLHGRLDQVICLDCGATAPRTDVQVQLRELNTHLVHSDRLFPDGDADVPDDLIDRVVVPDCPRCGGILKPDVVFFGDSVERSLVSTINTAIEKADALLVIGSSLMVYSGFRFCRYAAERGIPIACINPGTTRADDLFQLKLSATCGPVLERLVQQLYQDLLTSPSPTANS
jgi:NAD-dependent SIR2 family protein deacetylase